MKEAQLRQQIYNLLRRLWYSPHRLPDASICPHCRKRILPQGGRPDLLVNSAYGPGTYVEVKALNLQREKSFAFSSLSKEQRRYLNRRDDEGYQCYLALGIVGVPPGKRRMWLIPWDWWVVYEQVTHCKYKRESIPFEAGSGFAKKLQENKWELAALLSAVELVWSDGCWHAPEHHRIWQDCAPDGERDLGR